MATLTFSVPESIIPSDKGGRKKKAEIHTSQLTGKDGAIFEVTTKQIQAPLSKKVDLPVYGDKKSVFEGKAKQTKGGLTKEDLVLNDRGKVVSAAAAAAAQKNWKQSIYERLDRQAKELENQGFRVEAPEGFDEKLRVAIEERKIRKAEKEKLRQEEKAKKDLEKLQKIQAKEEEELKRKASSSSSGESSEGSPSKPKKQKKVLKA